MTDYICPVAVCNEQGGGEVKERKYVSVQANQDKATDEKKSQNERRAATKSYVKVDFVTRDNKESGFSKCTTNFEVLRLVCANRKLQIVQCDAWISLITVTFSNKHII